MTKKSRSTRQTAVLLTSASSLVLLSGCDFTEMKNPFAPDRPPQVVEGERRQPIYNQQMIQRMQAKSGAELYPDTTPIASVPVMPDAGMPPAASYAPPPPEALPPAPPPPAGAYPPPPQVYAPAPTVPPAADAFAAQPMNAPPPASPPPAMHAAPVYAPPAVMAQAPTQPMPRTELAAVSSQPAPHEEEEGFFSTFFSNRETTGPNNPPPWKMQEGVQEDYVEPAAKAASDVLPATPSEAQVQPAWADQWIGNAPQPDSAMEAARNAPYPALSSVPPRPEDFETARSASRAALSEMQAARADAAATRAVLSAEPSQAYKVTPVDMPPQEAPAPEAQAPVQLAPQPEAGMPQSPAPVMSAPAEPAMGEPLYPGGPRRGIDIMTQEEWEALQRRQQGAAPAYEGQQPLPQPGGQMLPPPEYDRQSGLSPSAGSPQQMAESEDVLQGFASFFGRVFGSSSQENTETDTPALIASEQHIEPAAPAQTPPVMAQAQAQLPQPLPETVAENAHGQPLLLPPGIDRKPDIMAMAQDAPPPAAPEPSEAEQAQEESIQGDWLLALVSQSKEDMRRAHEETLVAAREDAKRAEQRAAEYAEYDASVSPEKQLLAQMSAPPVFPRDNKAAPAKPKTVAKKAKPAPANETQLSLLDDAPKQDITPVPELAQVQDEAPAPMGVAKAETLPETAASAPMPPAAGTLPEPIIQAQVPAPETLPEPVMQAQAAETLPEPVLAAAEPEQPGWLGQMFSMDAQAGEPSPTSGPLFGTELSTDAAPESAPSELQLAALAMPPEQQAPQPPVEAQAEPLPPAPAPAPVVKNRAIAEKLARMEAEKAGKEAKLAAKKAKKETSLAKKKDKPEKQLAKKEAPAVSAPEPAAAPQLAEADMVKVPQPAPEVLASVSEPASADIVVPQPAQEAQTPVVAQPESLAALPEPLPEQPQAPILEADAELAQPAWFSRMFDKSKQGEEGNSGSGAVAVNQSPAGVDAASVAQNSAFPSESTETEMVNAEPQDAPEESKLPSLAGVAAPIAKVLAGDAAGLAAEAASALPSPKILQEIKMLPASRYSARVRASGLQDTH